MIMMMVFTRARSDEEYQLPTNKSVPEGSACAGTKRRRKHKSRKTRYAEQAVVEEETVGSEQPPAAQPRGAESPVTAQPGCAEIHVASQPGGAEILAAA
ncbi:hypothetical protein R6Q59_013581 [Mikania micrantha]